MSSYGLWTLVVLNSAIFIAFAFSFFRPRSGRDWRSFGAFSAFLVALFAEMYGFPLTIYLASGWLQSRFPGVDWFAHDSGHLLEMIFGWRANPHFGPFHVASMLFIGGGFVLLARAWPVLYRAQRAGVLATTGPYARVRHPQYVAFVLILFGFLLQWPTLLTLLMFPVLVWMYGRLALREEEEVREEFGEAYLAYARGVPRFLPRLGASREPPPRAPAETPTVMTMNDASPAVHAGLTPSSRDYHGNGRGVVSDPEDA
jgi:protein-S-isoprenylcysteine O-methyltransferase Ste14